MYLLITGASGAGTTTLGSALADAWALPHLDTDTFYWMPTERPFSEKRAPERCLALIQAALEGSEGAVVSGSVMGWGESLEDKFDLVVFLYVETEVRVARLRRRELALFGEIQTGFLEWAAQYDHDPPEGRSLSKHNDWLARRRCPVLRLSGERPVDDLVSGVRAECEALGLGTGTWE